MSAILHDNEPKGNALRVLADRYIPRGQNTRTPTQAAVVRAKGCRLWTADGRKLIDFTSGVLVSNLGYAHPLFEKRLKNYRRGIPRNGYNMVTEPMVEASRRLVVSMARRNPNAQQVLWAASGSEGVQKAMWCAMHHQPEKPLLIATRGGFHGKKGLAADVTGETSANPNVRFISFPLDAPFTEKDCERELAALSAECGGRAALLITEPYLGARGSFHPPKWYHPMLQEWCRAENAVFIFDEVQSCFGRTGNMYAFETYGVRPDLVVLGKGLANGEPGAAVVGRADVLGALDYAEGSDTYSATPGTCAAVCAALDVFREERVLDHVKKASKWLRGGLARLQKRFPFIRAVRGEGMVYGVEMTDAEVANRCVLEAYRAREKKGVHFLGPLAQKVLRVSPPLVMDRDEMDEAFALVEEAWSRIG